MTLLAVPANDIDISGVAIDAALPVSWLDHELVDTDVRGAAPGRVVARLSRSGKDVVVRGRVTARLTMPCARCLDPAPIEVDTELALLLKVGPTKAPGSRGPGAHRDAAKTKTHPATATPTSPRAKAARASSPGAAGARGRDAEYEFAPNEAGVDTFDGETVVLDGFVREALLLETPNFPLCSEACPGIRPAASIERGSASNGSVDPRLAPLGALRAKLLQGRSAHSSERPPRNIPAARQSGASSKPKKRSPLRANLTKTRKKKR